MRIIGILFAVLMLVPVAGAGEREEKIAAAREKIGAMLREAEELEELGRTEDARRLRHKAEDMRAKLEAYFKRVRKGEEQRHDADRHEGIARGLENGIEALMALGKKEEAEHLEEILHHVRRRMHEHEGAKRERDVARGHIKALRTAMHALLEADREDAAHIVESEIHAIEMRLEGRHKEIREVPSPGNMVECLMLSTELLKRWKKQEQAEQVHELMQMYRKRHRNQEGRREREHDRKREMRREREHDRPFERGRRGPPMERMEQLTERVEQLEERVHHLANLLEEMMQRERRGHDRERR